MCRTYHYLITVRHYGDRSSRHTTTVRDGTSTWPGHGCGLTRFWPDELCLACLSHSETKMLWSEHLLLEPIFQWKYVQMKQSIQHFRETSAKWYKLQMVESFRSLSHKWIRAVLNVWKSTRVNPCEGTQRWSRGTYLPINQVFHLILTKTKMLVFRRLWISQRNGSIYSMLNFINFHVPKSAALCLSFIPLCTFNAKLNSSGAFVM